MPDPGPLDPARWRQATDLFDRLADLPPRERAAILTPLRHEDPVLHALVTGLLARDAETSSPLDHGPAAMAHLVGPATTASGAESDPASLVGGRIGPYRIVRELGHGGMGVVFLAERVDAGFQQLVAIKCLPTRRASGQQIQRFLRERQILAGLIHPHIAQLHDGGITETGEPYLVMEYVEGERLDRFCDARRLDVDRRLRLFLGVCQAVQYAHQQLVVHRDLKPGNILVGAGGHPKLLDFGIAKLLEDEADSGETPESATTRALTPEYASPEQLRGERVTAATDVFSLGLILFELLTGRRPFASSGPLGPLHAVLSGDAPRASGTVLSRERRPPGGGPTPQELAAGRATTPAHLQRRLRGDLDTILDRALAREPASRYPSVQMLLDDIRRHLDGLPVLARPDSAGYRIRKLIGRNRLAAVAAGLAVLAMTGGTAAALWQARQARAQAAVADEQRVLADRERRTAERVSGFLQNIFASADASWQGQGARPGPTTTVLEVIDAAADRVDSELADEPDVAEALHEILSSIYSALGQSGKGEAQVREILRHQRERGAGPLELARGLQDLAVHYYQAGKQDSALSLLRESYAMFEQAGLPETEDLVFTLNHLGLLLWATGRSAEAEPYMVRAIALRRQLMGDDAGVAIATSNLGLIRDARGDLDGAERLFRQAEEIYAALRDREYFEHGTNLNNLAMTLFLKDQSAEAEPLMREAVALFRRTIGPDHATVGVAMFNLARIELARGRVEQALRTLRDGATRLGHLPPSHPDVARGQTHEAAILLAVGRLAEAERLARRSLATRTGAYAAGDWRIAETEGILGRILRARGREDQALPLLRRSRDALLAALGPGHPRTRAAERDLAAR